MKSQKGQFTRIHTVAYNTVRIAPYLRANIPKQKTSRDLKPCYHTFYPRYRYRGALAPEGLNCRTLAKIKEAEVVRGDFKFPEIDWLKYVNLHTET